MLVIADFLLHGWTVYRDVNDTSFHDLLVEKENRFLKIQVKTVSNSLCEESIAIPLFHKQKNSTNSKIIQYRNVGIDAMVLVCLDRNIRVYVPLHITENKTTITVRFSEPKIRCRKVLFASDCSINKL